MYMDSIESGGFIFENCLRNETLQKNENINIKDKCIKTGTTIAAMIFKVLYIYIYMYIYIRME